MPIDFELMAQEGNLGLVFTICLLYLVLIAIQQYDIARFYFSIYLSGTYHPLKSFLLASSPTSPTVKTNSIGNNVQQTYDTWASQPSLFQLNTLFTLDEFDDLVDQICPFIMVPESVWRQGDRSLIRAAALAKRGGLITDPTLYNRYVCELHKGRHKHVAVVSTLPYTDFAHFSFFRAGRCPLSRAAAPSFPPASSSFTSSA